MNLRNLKRQNIQRLEYFDSQGLLKVAKKKFLTNENCLFISSGCTGCNALLELKKLIDRTVDSVYTERNARRIRYLAVDCAHNELQKLVDDGKLEQDEIFKVPTENAVLSIDPALISEDKKQWVDPRLFNQVHVRTMGPHTGFEPNGAGAWRQPGRIRLTTVNGYEQIKRKITDLIGELSNPNDKLTVFFL